MWKAAAAFILAIGAGGFVAGSVLGDPGPPNVGDPIVLGEDGPSSQPPGTADPTARPTDDDGTADQGGGNDDDAADDDLDTIYHSPDDLSDDSHGRGRGRGRGGDDGVRDDHGGHHSGSGGGVDGSSGHGSGHDSGGHSGSDD
jgi:hypothetical protein